MKIKVLELGAGIEHYEGKPNEEVTHLDCLKLPHIEIVHDLDKYPWPFKDNTFDIVICSHLLEHLQNLIKAMQEIKRVCKNKAVIKIRVPHFSCGVSYRDPSHKRLFSYFTFDYFTDYSFYTQIKFKIRKRSFNFTRTQFTFLNPLINPIINLSPEIYERLFCWILPSAEVIVELEVIK